MAAVRRKYTTFSAWVLGLQQHNMNKIKGRKHRRVLVSELQYKTWSVFSAVENQTSPRHVHPRCEISGFGSGLGVRIRIRRQIYCMNKFRMCRKFIIWINLGYVSQIYYMNKFRMCRKFIIWINLGYVSQIYYMNKFRMCRKFIIWINLGYVLQIYYMNKFGRV